MTLGLWNWQAHCDAKIDEVPMLLVHLPHDVPWLDVSVDDLQVVDVSQPTHELSKQSPLGYAIKASVFCQEGEQVGLNIWQDKP